MMPFVNQWIFMKEGASFRVRVSNIIVGLLVALVATTLKALTGDTVQWYALGIGFYCAFSWAQLLVCRDKACFGMIFRCKTLRYVYLYVGLNTFTVSAIGFWTVPWLLRYYNVDAAGVGLAVGLSVAGSGLLGMISGGVLADRLRHHTQYGKLYVAIGTTCLAVLAKGMMLLTHDVAIIYGLIFLAGLVGSAGTAPAASTVSDLVIPRVRAIAMALVAMVNYFMGVALGPYSVGLLSDHLMASGVTSGEALRIGMLWSLVPMGCSIILLLLALKHLVKDEDSRLERARSFGEPI